MENWKTENVGKWKFEKFGKKWKMATWKNGTMENHMVPYGTIRYHKVPYGTIWYHMVPYDPPHPPGWGETLLGRQKCFELLTFKKNIFNIEKSKNHLNLSNIKEFWPFDVWKRIPTNSLSFWYKNHWKLTILSRVMILFGFNMDIHGSTWLSMVHHGYPWLTMDIHG